MAGIRKQTIQSSIIVYFGFAVGALNMYLYSRKGSFNTEQFGLTRLFFDFAQNIYAFASLGAIPLLYKFYPYYKDNLPDKKNDLLTRVLITSIIGFILVTIAGYVFEPFVVRKFAERSSLFLEFYHLVFPFSLGYLLFSILESYSWALQRTVLTNALKETVLRIITTVFILLYYFKMIDFATFMQLFSALYLIITLMLAIDRKSVV